MIKCPKLWGLSLEGEMGKLAVLLLACFGVFIAGCSSGPSDEEIAASVEAQVAEVVAETAEAQGGVSEILCKSLISS